MWRIALGVILSSLVADTGSAQTPQGFRSDFEAAQAHATATSRPLLIHFYADYCQPCRRMEATVLHDPKLTKELDALVVAVKVNTANRPDLAQRFDVQRIPHDRILSPQGKELSRAGGFMDVGNYLSMVQSAVKRHKLLTKPNPTDAGDNVKKRSEKPEPTGAKAPAKPNETPLGLGGFCPVQLSNARKWVKGKSKLTAEYKGVEYKLSSKEDLAKFKKEPGKYAPQVLGCDPVVLASSHRAIAGRIDYGAFFDGKLYLFQSSSSRATFKTDPLRYVRIQHALNVGRIERTAIR